MFASLKSPITCISSSKLFSFSYFKNGNSSTRLKICHKCSSHFPSYSTRACEKTISKDRASLVFQKRDGCTVTDHQRWGACLSSPFSRQRILEPRFRCPLYTRESYLRPPRFPSQGFHTTWRKQPWWLTSAASPVTQPLQVPTLAFKTPSRCYYLIIPCLEVADTTLVHLPAHSFLPRHFFLNSTRNSYVPNMENSNTNMTQCLFLRSCD